ncbi:PAS domain S-box protein [Dankookia sp. P2]|uniref:PAS domain S-box protein n=1 Tax=Dankookia sp. P2 TaxID=3423955 RepID=UPI003D6748CD
MRAAAAAFEARAITLVDAAGRIRLSTSWAPGERPDSPAVGPAQDALALGRPVTGNLYVSPSVGGWAVGVAVPLLLPGPDATRRVAQVLGFVLSPDRLAAILAEQRLPAGAAAGILDRDLTIAAATGSEAGTPGTRPPAAVIEALRPAAGMVPAHDGPDGQPIVAGFARAPQSGFRVTVALPAEAFEAPLRQALARTLLPGAGLLATSLGLGLLLLGRASRPAATGPTTAGHDAPAARQREATALRNRFEAGPVGLAQADAGGRILGANNAFLRIVGMTHADLDAGRIRWDDLTPPEWIGRDETAIAEAVRLGACAPYQKEFVRADGSRVPVLVFFAFDNAATGTATVFVVDLSGWAVTEAALVRTHEQMRLAIGAARMFFWDWNTATGEVEWSAGLEEACGLPRGAFGRSVDAFRALVHAEDLPRVEAALAAALADEAAYDVEFRMCRGDGGERWVLARGTVLRDGTGRPTRMVGIDLDITDRKLAELALARHGADLARIAEAGHVATFEVENAETSERNWFSPAYRRIFGLAPDAPCGFGTLVDRLHPEDRQRVLDTHALRARAGGQIADEFRILLPDGSIRWLQVNGEAEPALDGGTRAARMRGVIFDVTARRLAEAALAASEAKLRQVIEHAPLPMMVHDEAGTVLLVNRKWLQTSGHRREELPTVAAWLQRAHGEQAGEALAAIGRSFGRDPDDLPMAGEFPVRTAGGGTRIWRFHATDLGPAATGKRRLVTAAIDLTIQAQSEGTLADNAAQFRAVFEQAAVGIAQVGLDGRWLRVNARLCAILGYDKAELLALSFQDITHPGDLDADLALVQALLDGRRTSYTLEKRYRRRDGTLLWASLTVSLLRDAEGRPEHFVSVVEDISARRAAEAALAETEARQRELLATLDLGAFMARDLDGTIRFWSKGCERLYGWTAAEAIGRHAQVLLHTEYPAPRAEIEAALARDGSWIGDLRQRARDGTPRLVQSHRALRRDADGRPLAVLETVADVTAQREAAAALQDSSAALLLSQEAARVASYVQDLRTGSIAGRLARPWSSASRPAGKRCR